MRYALTCPISPKPAWDERACAAREIREKNTVPSQLLPVLLSFQQPYKTRLTPAECEQAVERLAAGDESLRTPLTRTSQQFIASENLSLPPEPQMIGHEVNDHLKGPTDKIRQPWALLIASI